VQLLKALARADASNTLNVSLYEAHALADPSGYMTVRNFYVQAHHYHLLSRRDRTRIRTVECTELDAIGGSRWI